MSKPQPLNCNPIQDGVFEWGDVTVEISPDASRCVIRQGHSNIVVCGSFFADVCAVLERLHYLAIDEQFPKEPWLSLVPIKEKPILANEEPRPYHKAEAAPSDGWLIVRSPKPTV